MNRKKSQEIYNRLCKVIPGGVNSPVRAWKGMKRSPLVVDSALGDTLTDVDGHQYIDYCSSWGALIHGHAHPTILDAVNKRMARGTSFGITTAIEEQAASKIIQHVDSVEKIRFVSSGTEATMSAVRLARGYTNRAYVIKFSGNYHGHADFFLVQAGSGVTSINASSTSAGIPQDIVKYTICLPYNDVEAFKKCINDNRFKNQIAAVIVEPIAGNMGVVPASVDFLKALREETQKQQSLLIFDEVISGFRVGLQGAQKMYGITPDLTCFGKIIGGGFPAAAFGGAAAIMNRLAPLGDVYQAGTLSGNPVAMEAGLQSIAMLEQPGVYEHLEDKCRILLDPIVEKIRLNNINACVQRVGSMFTIFFGLKHVRNMEEAKNLDTDKFLEFFTYLFDHGVYIPPSQYEAWFVSTVHSETHLVKTRDLILNFFTKDC